MNLQSKHNFTMAHFGLLLGVLKSNLQELQIQHCNDIFCRTTQVSPAATCLRTNCSVWHHVNNICHDWQTSLRVTQHTLTF